MLKWEQFDDIPVYGDNLVDVADVVFSFGGEVEASVI